MNKIISFEILKDYEMQLLFADESMKIVDFKPLIGTGISAKLLNLDFFKQVKIEDGGGLEWPNGMDFCPNYLKDFEPDLAQKHSLSEGF